MSRQYRVRRFPWPVTLAAVIAVGFIVVPIVGLIVRSPWMRIGELIAEPDIRRALGLSLATSLSSAVCAAVLGVPLAWWLAASGARSVGAVRAVVSLSMVMPPVVAGVGLFAAYGRNGLLGRYLDLWLGIRIPFTTLAVVMAQTFVALPFLVLTVEAALSQVDPIGSDAARMLGASPWYSFTRVMLPAVRPALLAGTVLAWARALGEFGATITFAGNLPGTTQTMPLATYISLQSDPARANLLAVTMIAISFAVLFGLRRYWGNPFSTTRSVT